MEINTSDFDGAEETTTHAEHKNSAAEDPVVASLTAQYARTIKENRGLFGYDTGRGVDTAEEYIEAFRTQSYDIKLAWFARLNTEIEGLRALKDEFMQLAPEDIAIFSGLRRHEKKELVKILKAKNIDLANDFRTKLFNSSNAKHFCKEEKEQAMQAFLGASMAKRKEMLKAVDSWLEFEAKRSDEFETLAKQLGEASPDKKQLADKMRMRFYEQPYKEKLSMMIELKEAVGLATAEEKATMQLTEEYGALLAQKIQEKVISKTTEFKFKHWFKHQGLDGKKEAISKFADIMEPRIALIQRFKNEINPELQAEEKVKGPDGFYALGMSGRTIRLSKLLEEQRMKSFTGGKDEIFASTKAKTGGSLDEGTLSTLIAEAKGEKQIRKRRRRHTIAREVLHVKRLAELRPVQKRRSIITARSAARKTLIKEGDTIDIGGIWRLLWTPGNHEVRDGMDQIGLQLQTNEALRRTTDVRMMDLAGNEGMRYAAADEAVKKEEARTVGIIAGRTLKMAQEAGKISQGKVDQKTEQMIQAAAARTNLTVDLTQ